MRIPKSTRNYWSKLKQSDVDVGEKNASMNAILCENCLFRCAVKANYRANAIFAAKSTCQSPGSSFYWNSAISVDLNADIRPFDTFSALIESFHFSMAKWSDSP